jgi:enoyl-CoA hydratase
MTIHTSHDQHVTVIILARPDVRNAVDADTARALHAAFIAFDDDPDAPRGGIP